MQQTLVALRSIHVVDDDRDFSKFLRLLLIDRGYSVATSRTAEEFLEASSPHAGTCVLIEARIPAMGGMELLHEIQRRSLPVSIVLMSAVLSAASILAAIQAGARDFIPKPFTGRVMRETFESIDGVFTSESVASSSPAASSEPPLDSFAPSRTSLALTARELEIARMVTEGRSSKVIAQRLSISKRTVDNHRARILTKLGVDNSAQLAARLSRVFHIVE